MPYRPQRGRLQMSRLGPLQHGQLLSASCSSPPDTLLWSPRLHRGWPAGRRRRHGRQRRGWRGPGPYPLAAEDSGGADQGEMGECLREVADLPAAGDVVLLGVQAEVVAQGEEPLEQLPRLRLAAVERERFDQPERAGKELALAARQAVVGDVGRVARDEAVVAELTADRVDGGREPVVGRVQQADQPDRQRAGIQRRGAIGLREGAALRVVGPLEDLIVDLRPDLLPAPQRPLQP